MIHGSTAKRVRLQINLFNQPIRNPTGFVVLLRQAQILTIPTGLAPKNLLLSPKYNVLGSVPELARGRGAR